MWKDDAMNLSLAKFNHFIQNYTVNRYNSKGQYAWNLNNMSMIGVTTCTVGK